MMASTSSTFNPVNVLANAAVIIATLTTFWRLGQASFKRAVSDQVAPATAALVEHAQAAQKANKKIAKKLERHTAEDEERFTEIKRLLQTIQSQGVDAADSEAQRRKER